MSKFSFNFTSVGGETKAIPDTHKKLYASPPIGRADRIALPLCASLKNRQHEPKEIDKRK